MLKHANLNNSPISLPSYNCPNPDGSEDGRTSCMDGSHDSASHRVTTTCSARCASHAPLGCDTCIMNRSSETMNLNFLVRVVESTKFFSTHAIKLLRPESSARARTDAMRGVINTLNRNSELISLLVHLSVKCAFNVDQRAPSHFVMVEFSWSLAMFHVRAMCAHALGARIASFKTFRSDSIHDSEQFT